MGTFPMAGNIPTGKYLFLFVVHMMLFRILVA
jgi:hypothetical protein